MKKYLFEQYTNKGQFIQNTIISQSSFESSINQLFQKSKTKTASSSFYVTSLLQNEKLIIKVMDTPSTACLHIHIQEQQ